MGEEESKVPGETKGPEGIYGRHSAAAGVQRRVEWWGREGWDTPGGLDLPRHKPCGAVTPDSSFETLGSVEWLD